MNSELYHGLKKACGMLNGCDRMCLFQQQLHPLKHNLCELSEEEV